MSTATSGRRGFMQRALPAAAVGVAGLSTWLREGPVWAHPYHTTDAQARIAPDTQTLQVALRVLPEDLEAALHRRTGHKTPLESTAPATIVAYLASHMIWRHDLAPRGAMPPRWVGMEVSVREAWLYFDYRLPSRARSLTVEHRVFFELEDDQINTLRFDAGQTPRTVTFHREQASKTLEFTPRSTG